MLHTEDYDNVAHRTEGKIGLELEFQRTDLSGNLSRTSHPFPESGSIVRDFGEAQLEINTSPSETPESVMKELHELLRGVHHELRGRAELLWPFSNPPIIHSEKDIAIASFSSDKRPSYEYRRYLAKKYGKYQMTYSGIHFNYSFSERLLRHNARLEGVHTPDAFCSWRNRFYLELAAKVLFYSWTIVALLGASPLTDSSFFEAGQAGETVFSGSASLRSSPIGYWNYFTPVLSYESMEKYVDSIQRYIDGGMISRASELYYPVRIKSSGAYSLEELRKKGADHIELRMIDLNPFSEDGIAPEDLCFLQLFLIWLASVPPRKMDAGAQLLALQNHKSAAAYDWSISRIMETEGISIPLNRALDSVLREMEEFYKDSSKVTLSVLQSQREKIKDENKRYAVRVRKEYGENYIHSGLQRAVEIQESFYV